MINEASDNNIGNNITTSTDWMWRGTRLILRGIAVQVRLREFIMFTSSGIRYKTLVKTVIYILRELGSRHWTEEPLNFFRENKPLESLWEKKEVKKVAYELEITEDLLLYISLFPDS